MKRTFIHLLSITAIAFASLASNACSSYDDEMSTTLQQQQPSLRAKQIEKKLQYIFNHANDEYTDGGYIVYDAKANEYMVMTPQTYGIGVLFDQWAKGETLDTTFIATKHASRAPEGKGWINAGTCKGRLSSIRMAYKIAEKTPEGRDFEIHAENNGNGTYTVWYRLL